MSIDRATVEQIAKLARIELDPAETEYYSLHLAKIVSYVEKINQLNLADIPPTLSPHSTLNVYRPDEPKEFDNNLGLNKILPVKEDNFIKIPKVID